MIILAPPPRPPRVAVTDGDDPTKRLRLRMFQVSATLVTLLGTVWVCTLGAIPAILGLMVAKHVLVAILMMGLGVSAPRADR